MKLRHGTQQESVRLSTDYPSLSNTMKIIGERQYVKVLKQISVNIT